MGYESGPVYGAQSYQEFRTVKIASTTSVGKLMVYDLTVDEAWTARPTQYDPINEMPVAGVLWNNEKTALPTPNPTLVISGGFCPSLWVETGNGGVGGTLPGFAVSAHNSPLINCPVDGYRTGTETGFTMPWLPSSFVNKPQYDSGPIAIALEAQAINSTGTIKAFILRR